LTGLKVVEFAHIIAGPLAGTLLADLGATVVHVEPPGSGDPGRSMGEAKDGVSLWWKVSARNKRSVCLDLRQPEGRAVAVQLAAWADVVISNIKADTLEKWGLDWPSLRRVNEKLVYLQISGFGAKSSLRAAPGFGKVGEARSGAVFLTGFADGPPVHSGFSHGDSVTALMGGFGIMAALYRQAKDPHFEGEWIDLALFESLFRLIEWQIIQYDQFGVSTTRNGNHMGVRPAAVVNTYLSRDSEWITVTSATPKSVQNIARLLGLDDSKYVTREQQREAADELDDLLGKWIALRDADECLKVMAELEVVASKIFSAEDIINDPTYNELKDIVTVSDPELGDVRMQGVIPRMDTYPGGIWRTGPALGEDGELVYKEWLGMADDEFTKLRGAGVI
jgi:formyl-CoA transferase